MDFHSLTRRELQSLCKINKIPANITNIAMADALKSLEIVEGIEEVLNPSKIETDGLVESMEKVEITSPRVPHTSCRTSTRQKVKKTEAENLPPTATRTTRRGGRQLAAGVEESKNDVLKTPAVSSTRKKALAASSCRNVNSQLNECEDGAKKEDVVDQELECIPKSPMVATYSRRKGVTASTRGATEKKEEGTVQKVYSTRRSTRLTEKKSAEPRVRKECAESVKINSFLDEENVTSKEEILDEVNVTSKEDSAAKAVEVPEKTIESGNPSGELEDVCNAFEKLDVLVVEESAHNLVLEKDLNVEATLKGGEEEVDGGELENLNPESDETSNPCEDGDLEEKLTIGEKFDQGEKDHSEVEKDDVDDLKPESDGISGPCEYENLEEKLDVGEERFDVIEVSSTAISGANFSAVKDHNLVMVPEEHSDSLLNDNAGLESGADAIDVDAIPFNTENLSGPPELGQEDLFCAVAEMKDQVPESNGFPTMVSDAENASEPLKSENANSFSSPEEISTKDMDEEVSENMVDETAEVLPTTDNLSTMIGEVQDLKPELFTESNVNEKADSGEEKTQLWSIRATPIKKALSKTSIITDDKENIESGRKLQIVIMDEEKKGKNERDENEKLRSLNEISIRQLRKQVKALTLKSINTNEDVGKEQNGKTRPALQALCDNQLAAGEIKN